MSKLLTSPPNKLTNILQFIRTVLKVKALISTLQGTRVA